MRAELDALFEARRQSVMAVLDSVTAEQCATFKDDIENLFEAAVDWLTFSHASLEFEMARRTLCRAEELALIGYPA